MTELPAILIGGPPHSGKSVLAYSLSQSLRTENIPHYLLRAYPDGEGDWSNESSPALAQSLRKKGVGDDRWVTAICRDIDHRHLPLLVDAGGRPTPAQEAIFSRCTHSILLAPTPTALAEWRTIAARHHLIPIAEFYSLLRGENRLTRTAPVLHGTVSGLERGTLAATGESINALLARLKTLITPVTLNLRTEHLATAPAETAIDMERLCRTLTGGMRWLPQHLPALLDYLPSETPLAIYGRAPGWIIAALARQALPAEFFRFDPRMGWVTPPPLAFGTPPADAPLLTEIHPLPNARRLRFSIRADYLMQPTEPLSVPPIAGDGGIILDGKIPQWLMAALARRYAAAPWLAVFQPQLNGAVVISTTKNSPKLGTHITHGGDI